MKALQSARPAALVALTSLFLQASQAGATDIALVMAPVHPGDRAAFGFTFTGHFSGSPETYTDTVVTQLKSDGSVVVNAPQFKPFTLTTKRDSEGLLAPAADPSPLGDILIDLNSVVTLTRHSGSTASGATWQAQIPVRISPDTWHDLPVTVTVARDRSSIALAGQGHDETTLFYHGYTFPVDVTLKMNEVFDAHGAFKSADLSVSEVTAGGSGPPISYNWQLDAH